MASIRARTVASTSTGSKRQDTLVGGGRLQAREPYDRLLEIIAGGKAGEGPVEEDSLRLHGEYFGDVGLRMLDDLLDAGRAWGADAVVYPGIHACGLVAARELDAVGVLHGYGSPLPTFAPALEHVRGPPRPR